MRRLVIELHEKEFARLKDDTPFENVRTLEIIHVLRWNREELAAICKVSFEGQHPSSKRLRPGGGTRGLAHVQVLERAEDGSFTIFLRSRPKHRAFWLKLIKGGGYLFTPFEVSEGRFRLNFLGSQKQVESFLNGAERNRLRYRIISLAPAEFSPDSPLNRLTQKQRDVLISAFKLGYFDVPRTINSEQLAARLNLGSSTVVEHVRKAERRLLVEMLGKP